MTRDGCGRPGRTAPECATALSVTSRAHVEVLALLRDGQQRSQRQVLAAVKLPKRQVKAALQQGVDEGWLLQAQGPRRSCLYRINYGVAPLLRRAPSAAPGDSARRPFDAYDARRLRVLPAVVEALAAASPGLVLASYLRAWRDCGGVEPAPHDERELWTELASVVVELVEPLLLLVSEYEFLPASGDCLTVGAQRRERVRDFGPAECAPCAQVHHLNRRPP